MVPIKISWLLKLGPVCQGGAILGSAGPGFNLEKKKNIFFVSFPGLPLVVEIISDKWVHCCIFLHIQHSLLCNKTGPRRGNQCIPIFWIYADDFIYAFPSHRYASFLLKHRGGRMLSASNF